MGPRVGAVGDLEAPVAGTALRPFYFTVVFWGPVYRAYFTDLLLASLLAPGNIPALDPARGSKVLISTTAEDWQALQSHPLLTRLKAYAEPVWLPLEVESDAHRHDRKMSVMSRGQAMLATRAFRDRAYGMYLTPDAMFADGSIAALERLVETGKKVVFAIAVRFQYEGAIPELQHRGYLVPGQPLVIGPRDLMRVVLRHLHSETRRYDFDAPWFAESPISPYWQVPGGDGLIFHTFSWAPLVMDYAALAKHDISTFENWTLDGDYVYRNFPNANDIYIVTDSDEVAYVSFTKEADLHFDLRPEFGKRPAWLINWYKTQLVRKLKDSEVMDPLKREVFPTPVCFHATDVSPAWTRTQQRAARMVADVYAAPGLKQRAIEVTAALLAPGLTARIVMSNSALRNILWCYRYRRFLWQRAKEKIGWSKGRSRLDDARDWITPTLGLMNPLWTMAVIARDQPHRRAALGLIRGWLSQRKTLAPMFLAFWGWRYRRYLWQRVKERSGWTRGRSRLGDARDWVSPTMGLMNPLWTVAVIVRDRRYRRAAWGIVQGWLVRRWFGRPIVVAFWGWRYRRYLWQRVKERAGWTQGRSRPNDERDWVSPALGVMNPLWTIVAVLRDKRYRDATSRLIKNWAARYVLRRRHPSTRANAGRPELPRGRDATGRIS
ncbi:MAG TPA: hypothetical protein VKW09_04515 [bacterium]|nr:hypothetical protein [bacterium]